MIRFIKSIILISIILNIVSCNNSGKQKDINTNFNQEQDSAKINKITKNRDIDSDTSINNVNNQVAIFKFDDTGNSDYLIKTPSKNYHTSNSGLRYRFIHHNSKQPTGSVGDIIEISLKYYNEKDSLIFNSEEIDKNFKMRINTPSHIGGSIENAYLIMHKYDSAHFKINAKDFYTQTQNLAKLPDYINPDEDLIFHIKIKDILTKDEFVKKHSDIYIHNLQQEESLIKRFLLNMNFENEPTIYESGLIHIPIKKHNKKLISTGDKVKIHYTASFIDGGVFDSTIDRGTAFEFTIGNHEVIPGLEEAVLNMSLNDISLFIIPFRLAYGEEKIGQIPPFSTLIFEIEIIDVRK
jgi:FKBP-type peptidyl-prolyl cis-trans isomerase